MIESLAFQTVISLDSAEALQFAIDSLEVSLFNARDSLRVATRDANAVTAVGTALQVVATVVAAFAAWQSWRSAEESEKSSLRAEKREEMESDQRQRSVLHVYYAATVRTPIHEAARRFRSEAKDYFRNVEKEFSGLGDATSDSVNDRAHEVLDSYLSERHQPFADAVAEATVAWDESPDLSRRLERACAKLEEEIGTECSKLPSRGVEYTFAASIDRGVGTVLRLVKDSDPALTQERPAE